MAKLISKVTLTELRVEELKTTGKTYYVNDAKQSGLSVRVSGGGVKAFVFTKFKHGRLTRITLGRVGALRLDAARIAVQKLHGDLAMGVDIAAARRAAAVKPETMQEAFERFMELKQHRANTAMDYKNLWRMHVPVGLKSKPVRDVNVSNLKSIVHALKAKPRTSNKVIALLKAIMMKTRFADNPAREIVPYPEQPRTRRLNVDELTRVWQAIESEKEWGDFFRVLILTGARRTAFCSMRWGDLDLDAGVWMIPVKWAKSKREMAVPLCNEAVRILKARRANCKQLEDWVWPSADSVTGHVVNPEKPWRRVLKAAGVKEHTTLHDIRRTLGSRLAMDGVADATISKILGHVSAQSLKHYLHLDTTAGKEAIEQVFAGVVNGRKE